MKARSQYPGFTIVELLIVIVVIAILAAITVVAFNGIQDRARNSALLSGIDAIEKGLTIYATQNGEYPKPTDVPGQVAGNPGMYSMVCLQPTDEGWPEQNGLESSECYVDSGGDQPTYVGYSAVVTQALSTVLSTIPSTSDYTISTGSSAQRGIIYQYMGGPQAGYPKGAVYLMYGVNGDQECGRGTKNTVSGNTVCMTIVK